MDKLQRQFYSEQDRISEITAATAAVKNLEKQITFEQLKTIAENTSDQTQLALEQIEQLKKVNTSLESQIKDAKSNAIAADIIAIVSLLFAIISCLN